MNTWIYIIGAIVIVSITIGLYFYFKKPSETITSEVKQESLIKQETPVKQEQPVQQPTQQQPQQVQLFRQQSVQNPIQQNEIPTDIPVANQILTLEQMNKMRDAEMEKYRRAERRYNTIDYV